MGEPRRPATLVAWFVRLYAFPAGNFPVDSSPPPVSVDLPRISLATSFALTRPHLAIAMVRREVHPSVGC